MSLLKRPLGSSKLDDSYSLNQSFTRGRSDSLNTSLAPKTKPDPTRNFNSIRQNVRQQVIQGYGTQGASNGRSPSPIAGSYNNFLLSPNSASSAQQNLFNPRKNSLNSPSIQMTTSQTDRGTFKKRIADSVVSRLSPGTQQPGGLGLSINRGLGSGVSNDIWGLKMTNPATLTLAGRSSSPPRSNVGSLTNLNNSRSSKLDLNMDAVNRFRSSPLRGNGLLNDVSASSRANLGSASSMRSPSGTLFQLQDEVGKKSFLPTEKLKTSQISIGITSASSWKKELPSKPGFNISSKTANATSSTTGGTSKIQEKKFNLAFDQKDERKPSKIITKLAKELDKIQNEPHRRSYSAASRNSNNQEGGSPSRFSRFMPEGRTDRSGGNKETSRFDFGRTGGSKGSFASSLSIPKLQELQDMFADLPEKEFDELPINYCEELIKLSSVIMHRVKTSNYYHSKPAALRFL